MYTDEERVKSLSRREVSVIFLTCQNKSLHEIATEIGRTSKLVSHYRTKAYRKLELDKFPDDQKLTYLKKLYCPILQRLIKTPKDIENWIPIDLATGKALLIVEVEEQEDEEEALALRGETAIEPFPQPEEPEPTQRPYWVIAVVAIAAVAIVYLLTRRPATEPVIQTVIVTPPPVVVTEAPTEVSVVVPTDTFIPIPTDTIKPTLIPTETQTVTPEPPPTKDPHEGELNLFESDSFLPAEWITRGEYTYWEGYIRIQDEPFIDLKVEDCGDNEGNYRLDILQIFDPQGYLIVNEHNLDGSPTFRLRTYQMPGFYRIFMQDNNTTENGGTLKAEFLKDQTVYLYP